MKLISLPLLLLVLGLFGFPPAAPAAFAPNENGARWLRAELPANVGLQNADCEQLASAVGRATLAHQPEALAILHAALTRGTTRPLRRGENASKLLPCACAKRIFSISVAAAPAQASALLDLATELYPDCASELAATMRDYDQVAYDYKDSRGRADDKNVVDGRNGSDAPDRSGSDTPGRGTSVVPADADGSQLQPTFDPSGDARTQGSRGDLTGRDADGLGFGNPSAFDIGGMGIGFPGAPGFVGSPPGGGFALPVSPVPVTVAVNG